MCIQSPHLALNFEDLVPKASAPKGMSINGVKYITGIS